MPIFSHALSVVKKLSAAGHIAYFAGGWVRDHLMNHPCDDIDIATSASVEEILALFPKTIPVGIAFGIVIVVENEHPFEVATFRRDIDYLDGRRPSRIEKATPEEDAQRRDFTINGLFYDPLKQEVIDYVDGQKDIVQKIIQAIGNPNDRFKEDRLRMMRAVRYATRFGFSIEQKTLESICFHADEILPSVAMERVWQEFKKMSRFAHFDKALNLLHELGLLGRIFPLLKPIAFDEIKQRTRHIVHFPKNTPTLVELLELFPKASLKDIEELCDYLKIPKQEKLFALSLHRLEAAVFMPEEWQDRLEPIEWAKLYADPHAPLCLQIIASRKEGLEKTSFQKTHTLRQEKLSEAILRLKEKNPVITAQDLFVENIPQGVLMGELLKEAEKISVNEGIYEKESLLKKLKKTPVWPKPESF